MSVSYDEKKHVWMFQITNEHRVVDLNICCDDSTTFWPPE